MATVRRRVERMLLDPPRTSDYHATRPMMVSSYFGLQGWGIFSLGIVDEMRHDPQVFLGMEQRQGPMHLAEFEVDAKRPEVKKFVEDTREKIWNKSLGTALECDPYGYGCSEVIYDDVRGKVRFEDLRPVHPRDAKPYVYQGQLAYVFVNSMMPISVSGGALEIGTPTLNRESGTTSAGGDIRLNGSRPNVPGKCLWTVHDQKYNRWYGRSVMLPVFWPWRLKSMPDGALENLAKYAYKHGFSGMVVRAPDESYSDSPGQEAIFAADFMRQLGEQLKTGANIVLSNKMDQSGRNYAYAIERYGGELTGSMSDLLQWPDWLDRMIIRGMGIPDEIITHQGNTGGYSRSQVAFTAFLISCMERLHRMSEQIDHQIIRPLVHWNFGVKNSEYTLKPKSLLPPEPDVIQAKMQESQQKMLEKQQQGGAMPGMGQQGGMLPDASQMPEQEVVRQLSLAFGGALPIELSMGEVRTKAARIRSRTGHLPHGNRIKTVGFAHSVFRKLVRNCGQERALAALGRAVADSTDETSLASAALAETFLKHADQRMAG